MSFLGGADCSTAGNPLSQFSKHVQDDKSLQRDRLTGRGPGGVSDGFRQQNGSAPQDQMMSSFLQQGAQIPEARNASPFAMEHMRRELENYQNVRESKMASNEWSQEFGSQRPGQMDGTYQSTKPGFSSSEYARFTHQQRPELSQSSANPTLHPAESIHQFNRPYGMNYQMGTGMAGLNYGAMNHGPGVSNHFAGQTTHEAKGKGRMVELDDTNWEEQFAQMDAAGEEVDTDAEANAAMERELNDLDRSVVTETNDFGDFESIWKGVQAERAASREMWGREDGFGEGMHMGDLDHWDGFEGMGTHGGFERGEVRGYLFEEENFFRDVADPFGEGVKVMEEGGNLSLAALAFEAAVQREPEHVQAWTMLGSVQAQNEKESPAIRALEHAERIEPTNLSALMGLAVSYTNEGWDSTAYRTLERWLSVKYPEIVDAPDLTPDTEMGYMDRHQLHTKVTNYFIQAAQLSPGGEQMDPDVQVGLGVLFYGVGEHEKAVDCFTSALASTESGSTNERRQLHLLWNRLGATLANSGRSEEAIEAYEKALTLNPNFVRARYNLGVSCINIGCYDEAAQHLLGALSMHRIVEAQGRERAKDIMREAAESTVTDEELDRMITQNESTNLYDTLKRVFGQMGRQDLKERVAPAMDIDAFRSDFDF